MADYQATTLANQAKLVKALTRLQYTINKIEQNPIPATADDDESLEI